MRHHAPAVFLFPLAISACGARSDLATKVVATGNASGLGGGSFATNAVTGGASDSANQGGVATRGGGSAASGSGASGTTNTGGSNCPAFGEPSSVGTLLDYPILELSGLAASRRYPGMLYAHADSGAPPELAAFDSTGRFLGSIWLDGATALDWEDMAIGVTRTGSNQLYIGDIGDNEARAASGLARTSIQIYRFPEPDPNSLSNVNPLVISDWQAANYVYPTTACDAEALLSDPVTRDLLLITKANDGRSLVFSAPMAAFDTGSPMALELVAEFTVGAPFDSSALVTAADISPTGDRVIVRTYTSILLYPRLGSWAETFAAMPVSLAAPGEPQGEGLAFSSDGTAWLSGGEQSQAIYRAESGCP